MKISIIKINYKNINLEFDNANEALAFINQIGKEEKIKLVKKDKWSGKLISMTPKKKKRPSHHNNNWTTAENKYVSEHLDDKIIDIARHF